MHHLSINILILRVYGKLIRIPPLLSLYGKPEPEVSRVESQTKVRHHNTAGLSLYGCVFVTTNRI